MTQSSTLFPYLTAPADGRFPALGAVASPRAAVWAAGCLVALLFASITALVVTPWVQNVAGSGRVTALTPSERQQPIDTPVEGRVVRWHVVEGSTVKPGDLIAELADNDPALLSRLQAERDAVLARRQAAQWREQALAASLTGIDGSRVNALSSAGSRVEMARERVSAADQGLVAAEATLETARLNMERQRRLLDRGLASTRTVELAQLDEARALTELDRAKAVRNAACSELLAIEADRQKTSSDFQSSLESARASQAAARVEVANADAELQRMDVRLARQTTQIVKAPRAGKILRLLAQPFGEVLKAGDPIALLVPEVSSTIVELYVKGNDVPLLSEGRKVRLQFEGWPALQFAGWPSVAVGTFGGVVKLIDATDNGQGRFRILVAPDEADEPWPSSRYLRQGVRANGWVLLNSVPLWYEVWRQFNGFPPAIAPPEPATGGGK